MSKRQKSERQKPDRQKAAHQKSTQQKSAKRHRPDPDFYRSHLDEQVRVRRALCSMLCFWQLCGHKRCLRARACALASNDCFGRFWPLVPEETKIRIRAGMEAKADGRSVPEVAAAIAHALARWRETQAPAVTSGSAPPAVEVAAAPPRVGAPARAFPRVRVL